MGLNYKALLIEIIRDGCRDEKKIFFNVFTCAISKFWTEMFVWWGGRGVVHCAKSKRVTPQIKNDNVGILITGIAMVW